MSAALLIPALLVDAVAGEPRWLWSRLPHPAVLMGRSVAALDAELNIGANRRLRGVAAVAVLVAGAALIGFLLSGFGWAVEVLVAAILLAQRSLADHVAAVADGLRLGIVDARMAVARIVGRDTSGMDQPAAARAAIESAAENLSDGVVAPAFWFLVAGLPGLLIYKVVNTADSMIGHRTPRHAAFGWAAARLDDVLNWIPSRLTALLILAVTWRWDGAGVVLRDAPQHRSPNAGWPEAAMATSLGIAISGPRSYHGEMRDEPWVNPEGQRNIGAGEVDAAVSVLWKVWGAMLVVVVLIALF